MTRHSSRIALLRHGHTAWNRAGRIQGSADEPLDAAAQAEIAGLSPPPPWDQADVLSSPQRRAAHTAELLTGRAPSTHPRLQEMSWGAWEGLRGVDLIADPDSGYRHIEDWGWDYRPPGGETPAEVLRRVRPALAALTQSTLVVCHIGVMRAVLAEAYGWEFRGPAPFQVKRGRLYVVTASLDGFTNPEPPIRLIPQEAAPCA